MSKRDSGYQRQTLDSYATPFWVIEALIPYLPKARKIWEPACGDGNVVRVLADHGYDVYATDKIDGEDFFEMKDPAGSTGIISNPPFSDSAVFIQHAIDIMMSCRGFVAMLLPVDYDSAKSRRPLFADCPIFSKKIVLLKRIVWFERDDGKKAAPSENHAFYIWDWKHVGAPTIAYATGEAK